MGGHFEINQNYEAHFETFPRLRGQNVISTRIGTKMVIVCYICPGKLGGKLIL